MSEGGMAINPTLYIELKVNICFATNRFNTHLAELLKNNLIRVLTMQLCYVSNMTSV